jgi:hypothetical protein
MDSSPECNVAVVRVQLVCEGVLTAEAYVIVRRHVSDLEMRVPNPRTQNADLLAINTFIMNNFAGQPGRNVVNDIRIEAFEVAYGVSLARTILLGRNGEALVHRATLAVSGGHTNLKMHALYKGGEDFDRYEHAGRSARYASTIGASQLRSLESNGRLMVTHFMICQTRPGDDEFNLIFWPRPIPVHPLIGR